MIEDAGERRHKRRRWVLGLAFFALFLAISIVPPLVSINNYKGRITHLMSSTVGRPVRLSSVEMRLLPTPGFVLTDLTIEEDPIYGAEPVLHANRVVASVRLLSLWRGRLEIGRISVDEASLNIVRTNEGLWNFDPFFRTAAQKSHPAEGAAESHAVPLPYLEATNSRINFMRGSEKLPFSLVNADLSFWQENPGDWRVRLKGEPSRTDQSLELSGSGDTGVVRLEASLRRAAELRQMPLHVDLEWSDAQAGQLTRLALGSDAGWRGNLTGEIHLDGTLDAAQVKARLRADSVHRAEFAPIDPLDFDARCSMLYRFSQQAVDNLACDSPLGNGHVRLTGDIPAEGRGPHLSMEMDKISAGAVLDAMRTVRSGIGRGLEARGAISGKLVYNPDAAVIAADSGVSSKVVKQIKRGKTPASRVVKGPLTGSLVAEGLQLSGDSLSSPIEVAKVAFEPAQPSPGQHAALMGNASIALGGATAMTVVARVALSGYEITLHGPASVSRARELAKVAGLSQASLLDSLAGEPIVVDLNAEGPWVVPENIPAAGTLPQNPVTVTATQPNQVVQSAPPVDKVAGTISVHNANWKADYLANAVMISQATQHFDGSGSRWDPVVFAYGPVNGTAIVNLPAGCIETCTPKFEVDFGTLDAGALQAAILGAQEKGTLLSELISKLSSKKASAGPQWPVAEGTVKAETLVLGNLTLHDATAAIRLTGSEVEIANYEAKVLGGHANGNGVIKPAGGDRDKPSYTVGATFEKLNPAAVGELAGLHWKGGELEIDGKVDLSGFTGADLEKSAHGLFHFDWKRGSLADEREAGAIPAELARFDRWTGEAEVANGTITLKENSVKSGVRKGVVDGTLAIGDPAKVTLAAPKVALAKR
jgi:uncharacterized protein involved in outer membrane biogenesis